MGESECFRRRIWLKQKVQEGKRLNDLNLQCSSLKKELFLKLKELGLKLLPEKPEIDML